MPDEIIKNEEIVSACKRLVIINIFLRENKSTVAAAKGPKIIAGTE